MAFILRHYYRTALGSDGSIKIEFNHKLEDLKNYSIGVVKEDAREQYLLGKGFKLTDLNRIGGKNPQDRNFKKLLANRIDVWPMPDAVAYYVAKQHGHNNAAAVLKKLFPLDVLTGGYYLAASLNTSDKVVSHRVLPDGTTIQRVISYSRIHKYPPVVLWNGWRNIRSSVIPRGSCC